MKYLSILTVALAVSLGASAQKPEFKTDHTFNVSILGNAKDSLFTQILRQYDSYIHQHPKDSRTSLERCKFIQKSYYDEYEDYNPKAGEAESCAQELITRFPDDPEVLIFATEFIYGDSSLSYLNTLVERIDADTEAWKLYSWMVYQQLAQHHHYNDENNTDVIQYATMAMNENDTLDLSVLLATAHKNLNQHEEAIDILLAHLDSTNVAWELNQKGNLLLELGVPEKALEAFRYAARDSSGYEDLSSLAQAMIDNGLITEARDYLLKDYQQTTWNKIKPLSRLLEYDLTYASPDSAALTYDRFVADSFWNDALGIYRWRLFIKSPLHGWTLSDLGRVFMLLLIILVVAVIPYLWILPIHYFGQWQRSRGRIFPASSFNWGLRHFWLASSLWLFCDFLVSLVLDYPGILSLVNSNLESAVVESVSKESANFLLLFCVASLFVTTIFLKKEDVLHFIATIRENGRAILTGIGLALGLRFCLGIYIQLLRLFDIRTDSGVSTLASITDSIVSVNQFYSPYLGFLLVVIMVPFYEEVLFRGIFLSACERNMKFIFANILQSAVFALVHNDLKLAPFYFAFGMVAGNYRNRTQGLLTGTSMHATNNLIAFVVTTALRS